MGAKRLICLLIVASAELCFGKGIGLSMDDGEKPELKTPLQIEKMVNDLGDRDFRVREQASKQLSETPGAITFLRAFLNDKDLERRRRAEAAVESLTRKNVRTLFQIMRKKKHQVPLDLLTETISLHRDWMENRDWKEVLATITSVSDHILKGRKGKPQWPDFDKEFFSHPRSPVDLMSVDLGKRSEIRRGRLFGTQVELLRPVVSESTIIATGSINLSQCVKCVLIAGGSFECSNCLDCIVLSNGEASLRNTSGLFKSFVYCDGDFACKGVFDSLVIARGRVRVGKVKQSEIIEKAGDSPHVTLFSMKTMGLILLEHPRGFRIQSVVPGSQGEKSGFCVGDIITQLPAKTLRAFEADTRRILAKQNEVILDVSRQGRQTPVLLRVWE